MDVYVQPSTFVKERQSHAQIASLLQSLRPTTHASNNQCHVMATPRRSEACAEERARATEANARLDEVLQADEHKENRAASTIEAGAVAATLAAVLTELHRVKDEQRGHEMRMRQMEDELCQMEDDLLQMEDDLCQTQDELCQMKDGLRHTTAHGQATEARLRQTESIMFTEMADARLYAVARHAERLLCREITAWLTRFRTNPTECAAAVRDTLLSAFRDARNIQRDINQAICGLEHLTTCGIHHVLADEDTDKGVPSAHIIRLLNLVASKHESYVYVKKLALATMFPDGTVANGDWHLTMKAWAHFGGFRGVQQHPTPRFRPDLPTLRRCVQSVSFDRFVIHEGRRLSAGGEPVRNVFVHILNLMEAEDVE